MGEILDSFSSINSEDKTKHNNTKKNKENNTHRCRQRLPEIWHKVIQLELQGVGALMTIPPFRDMVPKALPLSALSGSQADPWAGKSPATHKPLPCHGIVLDSYS